MERLVEMFDEIIDVRDSREKLHCATHIMVMSVYGILNKCMDFEDIYDYAWDDIYIGEDKTINVHISNIHAPGHGVGYDNHIINKGNPWEGSLGPKPPQSG